MICHGPEAAVRTYTHYYSRKAWSLAGLRKRTIPSSVSFSSLTPGHAAPTSEPMAILGFSKQSTVHSRALASELFIDLSSKEASRRHAS
jgi:hypothetical protein